MVLLPGVRGPGAGAGPGHPRPAVPAPRRSAPARFALTSGWTGRVRRTGVALLRRRALMRSPGGARVSGLRWRRSSARRARAWQALTDILRFAVLQRNTPDELRGRISSLWQVQVVAARRWVRWWRACSAAAGADTALLVYGVACLLLTRRAVAVFGARWRVTNDPAPAAAPAPDPRPSEPAPRATSACPEQWRANVQQGRRRTYAPSCYEAEGNLLALGRPHPLTARGLAAG